MLFVTASFAFAQNDLSVTQQGDANTVDAISGNTATQDASAGGANLATINQTAGLDRNGNPTGGHQAFISQVSTAGDVNMIDLTQSFGNNALGNKGSHVATLSQNGEGNMITGTQDSRSNRVADVYQEGNDNASTFINGNIDVDQIGNENTAFSRNGGTVVQYQEGDRNDANNFGNSATQIQTGDDNTARSTSWVSGTDTYQLQDGDWNHSNFDNLRGGDSNHAYSEQYGNYNTINAYWNQNGSNSATVIQTSSYLAGPGQGNTATIDFQSTGNMVDVMQNGLSNTVYSYQQ